MEYTVSEKISHYELMTELLERVRTWRPSTSRNTVWLALRFPTTPTRERIRDEAAKMVEEYELRIAEENAATEENVAVSAGLD